MALTPAERQRRSKRHRNGDHSLCDPARCGALGRQATAAVVSIAGGSAKLDAGTDLGSRGQALWDELSPSTSRAMQVVLVEACRLADRLDRLDDYLNGRSDVWLRLHSRNDDGSIVEVVVDAALAEARQQALALRQLMSDLKGGIVAQPITGVSRRDQFAARRAARLADAAGR